MITLTADNLAKSFGGVHAVRGVSFQVAAGEMLALIGPNGAGKSTCFNMVGGQLRPDSGRVTLEGRDVTRAGPRAKWQAGMGRTFQIPAIFGSMLVRENVQVALLAAAGQTWGAWRPVERRFAPEAQALLDQVGLGPHAERPAAILAYGDVKRLELALALAHTPKLLLMDEPTAGVAPAERGALMRLVRDLATARGIAILFTEHDMDVVFGAADRILVLDRGEPVAAGPPAAIRADPRVRAIYLGEP